MRFTKFNVAAFVAAISAVIFSAAFQPAEAATTTYTTAYAVGTGTTINAADTVLLNNGATVTGTGVITANGTLQVNQTGTTLTFGNTIGGTGTFSVTNTGTVTLTGANRTLDLTTSVSAGNLRLIGSGTTAASLLVGSTGTGSLNVSGGLVSGLGGTLGNSASGVGSATVSSGTWASSSSLFVGNSGKGTLTVNGGYVSSGAAITLGNNAGSGGSATVSSGTLATSSSVVVGNSGTGTLSVTGGLVSSGALNVGNSGTGTLIVNGGRVSGSDSRIGNGGVGTATVSSGTLALSNILYVSSNSSGTGLLTVNGGYVSSADGNILQHGTVTVSSGTWANSGNVFLSSGTLNVNGGYVSTASANYGSGRITVSSGTLAVSTEISLYGTGATLNVNGGLLTTGSISAGAGLVTIGAGGTVQVSNYIQNDVVNNGALILAGSDNGVLDSFAISGTGSVTKQGSGTWVLNNVGAANTYTGPTNVNGGTLQVNNTLDGSAVTVNAGGALGGYQGTILGGVTVASSGTIGVDNIDSSLTYLTVGSLSLLNGSHSLMTIFGSTPSNGEFTQFVGSGGAAALTYGGNLDLVLSGSYAEGTTWNLFENFLTKNGDFSAINLNATGEYAGLTFSSSAGVWKSTTTVNNQYLEFTPSTGQLAVVPEPTQMVLVAGIGATLGAWRLRKLRRNGRGSNATAC